MNARKSIEIGQRIDKLAQSLQINPLRKADRPTRLRPGSLEAKVAASPYASILASPLRRCTFHRRMFPSQMLLRFGLERKSDSKKDTIVPFPEVSRSKPAGPNGAKYYIRLRRPVLDVVAKQGSRALFRGKTQFQKDTMEKIGRELIAYIHAHYDPSQYIPLKQLRPRAWCKHPSFSNDTTAPTQFQCILLVSPASDGEAFCQMNHHIFSTSPDVPCYDLSQLFKTEDLLAPTLNNNNNNENENDKIIAYGVPKQASTVELAVALWRYRAFLDKKMRE